MGDSIDNVLSVNEVLSAVKGITENTNKDIVYFEGFGRAPVHYLILDRDLSPRRAYDMLNQKLGGPVEIEEVNSQACLWRFLLGALGIGSQQEYLLFYKVRGWSGDIGLVGIYLAHSRGSAEHRSRLIEARSAEFYPSYKNCLP